MLLLEVGLVLVLIVANGVLAGSELAVVSSRPARLRAMADAGSAGAAAAARLQADPGRFLSAVQIGITLVGVLSGAFSGATLGRRLADALVSAGVARETADVLGVVVVVAVITYLSLVIGELVPKQLALRRPERLASAVAPGLELLSRLAAAPVWLLDRSTDVVVRLLGGGDGTAEQVTEEEVRALLGEAEEVGVLEPGELRMIDRLLVLGDRRVRTVMTPRVDVERIDLTRPVDALLEQIRRSPYSRFPAHDGDPDHPVGVLDTKRLIGRPVPADAATLRDLALVRPVELVESADARDAVLALKRSSVPVAVVFDEHGGFEGIVTATDILEAIVGEFPDEDGTPTRRVRRDGEGWLVEGTLHVDDVAAATGLPLPPADVDRTIAGVLLAALGHLPDVGDAVDLGGVVAEVAEMDRRRIAWIRLTAFADGAAGA